MVKEMKTLLFPGMTEPYEIVDAAAREQLKTKADSSHTHTVSQISDLTATAAELNIMDGVIASTTEINKLNGVTATTDELNCVEGVTSNIQSQLDNKADLCHVHMLTFELDDNGNMTFLIADTSVVSNVEEVSF